MDERRALLSQRVAGLVGEYILGLSDTRSDIRTAVDAFANADQFSPGAAAARGIRPTPAAIGLHTAVVDFLARARRIVALPPHDAGLATAAAPIFSAAREPLFNALNSALLADQTQADQDRGLLRMLGIVTALALVGTLFAAVFGIVLPIVRRAGQLAHDAAELERVATTDPVTGLLNRRSFEARGEIEIHKAKRYNRPLSLLVIGPDQLGAISKPAEERGNDAILDALTATLMNATRATELVGRVNGTEFAVLLPETDVAGAQILAERLRRDIAALGLPVADTAGTFTVSIGVATAEKDASFFAPTCERAADALYEARIRGHNQVRVSAASPA